MPNREMAGSAGWGTVWNAPDELYDAALLGKLMWSKPQREHLVETPEERRRGDQGRERFYARNAPGCLQCNGDGKPDVGIAAIVEVVSIVVVDVDVIGAIPVFRPVFRIGIDQQK